MKKVIAFILMCLLVILPVVGGMGIKDVRADETNQITFHKVDSETNEE